MTPILAPRSAGEAQGQEAHVWDVAVVGAGPAGSAAALSALRARPDARVLLLDRADFPRDKSCGDGVAPHAVDELALLGAGDLLADRVPVRRLRIVSPGGAEVASTLRRPDVVVPRTVLDARLVEAAVARGAVLERRTIRRVSPQGDHVVLSGSDGWSVEARVVVGADGANGVVRRQVGVPRQPEGATAVAVRGYAPSPPGEPEQLIVMAEKDWPAYAWRFDAGDGTSNVGFGMLLPSLKAISGSGRDALHGRLVELLPGTAAERLVSHHLPLSTWRPTQPPGRVLLAGDAMSLINPLTGEGIFYALLSGRLAGTAAVGEGDAGRAYGSALSSALGRHLRHTSLLARLTRRAAVLDLGVKAAARSSRAFDDLVELGLGRGLITPRLVAGLAREAGARGRASG
jgi:menaquinone-9 beta-reductase